MHFYRVYDEHYPPRKDDPAHCLLGMIWKTAYNDIELYWELTARLQNVLWYVKQCMQHRSVSDMEKTYGYHFRGSALIYRSLAQALSSMGINMTAQTMYYNEEVPHRGWCDTLVSSFNRLDYSEASLPRLMEEHAPLGKRMYACSQTNRIIRTMIRTIGQGTCSVKMSLAQSKLLALKKLKDLTRGGTVSFVDGAVVVTWPEGPHLLPCPLLDEAKPESKLESVHPTDENGGSPPLQTA